MLAAIDLGPSNGRLEGLNSNIRLLSHRAYGFHSANALIATWSSPGFVDTCWLSGLLGPRGCLLMPKIPPYSEEFKREAVRLLGTSGRSVPQLAKELGVSQGSLRGWASQRDVDEGKAEGLSSSEREELRGLRREVKVLEEEREILKKAAAFFASESRTR